MSNAFFQLSLIVAQLFHEYKRHYSETFLYFSPCLDLVLITSYLNIYVFNFLMIDPIILWMQMHLGYLCFPDLELAPSPSFCFTAPTPICIWRPRLSSCIYPPWLIRIENNKRQRLYIMLLSLFLTVVV